MYLQQKALTLFIMLKLVIQNFFSILLMNWHFLLFASHNMCENMIFDIDGIDSVNYYGNGVNDV